MKITENRKKIQMDFNVFFLEGLRRILWKERISPTEFFSYLIELLVTGDPRIHEMLGEVKAARARSQVLDIVHTDDESLYSLIEELRRKEG